MLISDFFLIQIDSIYIYLGILFYSFYNNNLYNQKIVGIISMLLMLVFFKEIKLLYLIIGLVGSFIVNYILYKIQEINEEEDIIIESYKIDYYKEQISSRMNIFNLLGVTVAVITYFVTFYIMDVIKGKELLVGREIDFYFGLFMVGLVGIAFFVFLFNVTRYHKKIRNEILARK